MNKEETMKEVKVEMKDETKEKARNEAIGRDSRKRVRYTFT